MKAGNGKIEISCFFVYTQVLKGNSKFFRKVRVTTLTQGTAGDELFGGA